MSIKQLRAANARLVGDVMQLNNRLSIMEADRREAEEHAARMAGLYAEATAEVAKLGRALTPLMALHDHVTYSAGFAASLRKDADGPWEELILSHFEGRMRQWAKTLDDALTKAGVRVGFKETDRGNEPANPASTAEVAKTPDQPHRDDRKR